MRAGEEATAELAVPERLLDVLTGEVLPATVPNAARVLEAAREMKRRMDDVIAAVTEFALAESQRAGTKTLVAGGGLSVVLTGGESVEYDPADLMEALRESGCPEGRIEEAVVATVSYKVNRSVTRQLAAANPDYRAAVELAERRVEKPYRATVKGGS